MELQNSQNFIELQNSQNFIKLQNLQNSVEVLSLAAIKFDQEKITRRENLL